MSTLFKKFFIILYTYMIYHVNYIYNNKILSFLLDHTHDTLLDMLK